MPIMQEFIDVVATENLKLGASWPAQRLTHSTMDQDRIRVQMGDNAVSRQDASSRSYQILNARMMKDVVEPDPTEASAVKEIATGVSPTSQGYHWANQNQQIDAALSSSINQLGSTVSSVQAMLAQLVSLLSSK